MSLHERLEGGWVWEEWGGWAGRGGGEDHAVDCCAVVGCPQLLSGTDVIQIQVVRRCGRAGEGRDDQEDGGLELGIEESTVAMHLCVCEMVAVEMEPARGVFQHAP